MNKVLLVLGGIVAIFLSAVIGTQFIGVLGASSESVRVVDAMESLSCSVAIAPATTCIVTLAAPHAHGDTSHLVITETSPGGGERSASLNGANRVDLTIAGLSPSTNYAFSVAYETENEDAGDALLLLLRFWPVLAIVAVGIIAWGVSKKV